MSESKSDQMINRQGWAIETCTRCAGCGEYSFNARHGRVCYGCSGTGVQFTKRAKQMRDELSARLREMRSTPIEDVRVGDRLVTTHGGREIHATVSAVTRDEKSAEQIAAGETWGESTTTHPDGTIVHHVYSVRHHVHFENLVTRYGEVRELTTLIVHNGATVQRINDAAAEAQLIADAKRNSLGVK